MPSVLLHFLRRARRFLPTGAALLLWAPGSLLAGFVHPGGLHTQADLDRMKAQVAAGAHPWIDDWNVLITDRLAQNTYTASPQANMGVSRQRASQDAHAAYLNALRWYISGDTSYADCAVRICNGWSAAVNQVPTGNNIPGLSGIPIAEFAYVGEILRLYPGWAASDFQRYQAMMETYFYPVCHAFLVNHNGPCDSHYWANWDLCNIGAIMGIGVLCDDAAKFNEAVQYYESGVGNGCLFNAVPYLHPNGLGQWQESGRDQEHAQLGVGLAAAFCQMAWNQGVDLFGLANNRLLAGAEYVARTTLNEPVPYVTYDNCDHVNQYFLSTNGLGRLDDRPIWELLYNHYVVRMGLSAPAVTALAQLTRPERGSADHFGYGTLTFTLDAQASPFPVEPVPAAPTGVTATAAANAVALTWDVPADNSAQGHTILRATAAAGPFATVATLARTTANSYTDTAVTAGTTYYYQVLATNQTGTGPASATVSATPAATTSSLAPGWFVHDIGAVSAAGTAAYCPAMGNTFVVSGSGNGIGSTRDACGFTGVAVTGDVSITARLTATAGSWNKTGLMIRGSFAPDAPMIVLSLGGAGDRVAAAGFRSNAGGNTTWANGDAYTWLPAWFRLQRSGDTFSAAQSSDGVNWVTIATATIPMGSNYYAGLVTCSGGASSLTSTFDHAAVAGTELAAPPANLTAVDGESQVALSWNASANATGYNVKRAATSGGPYTAIASGVSGTTYTDAGLPNWSTYYYVVSAVEGAFESVDSSEVSGTPGDITDLWSNAAATGAWSAGANWAAGSPPTQGESVAFGASPVATLTNDLTGVALTRITFNAGAPAFTIGGNGLVLNRGITNDASAPQTLTLPLALNGAVTVNAAAGPMVLGGALTDGGAAGGIVKAGAQAVTLTGANTFSGDVVDAAGVLALGGAGTGSAGAPAAGPLGRGRLQLGGGTLTSTAAGAKVYNDIVLRAGTTSAISSAVANLTLAGNLSGGGTVNESGANYGGTHLAGDNSGFTGTFVSGNNGKHRVRFDAATAGSARATWVLNNSPIDGYGFAFGNGTISFGALSGSGYFRNEVSGSTVIMSIGALNTNATFAGTLVANHNDYIGVTKVGAGVLTFTGSNSYNGPTTVTAGTLLVNKAFASPVTVTGGTFGGVGTSSAAITVGTGAGVGATLAPGSNAIGTFTTTANVTLNADATYAVELNSSSAAVDEVVAGSVTLNAPVLSLTDVGSGALAYGTTLTILHGTGTTPVAGAFKDLPEGALVAGGANTFRISYHGGTGGDVTLTAVVPPPVFTSASSAAGQVGVPFRFAVTATHGATYGATGLPAGLGIDPATGVISGTPSAAGTSTVTITAENATATTTAPLLVAIAKGSAVVTLAGLTQTYSGLPEPVAVGTVPAGLPLEVTYAGSATPPTNAGTYAVSALVDDPNYAGAATATLVIARAAPVIAVTPYTVTYDQNAHIATGSATGVRGEALAGLDLSATTHTNAGVYVDPWTFADGTGNYTNAVGSTVDTIEKAKATVTLAPLTQWYDGTSRPVTATTAPAGLTVVVTYNGGAAAPVYPGRYDVIGTIDDPNYAGTAEEPLDVRITALARHVGRIEGSIDGSLQVLSSDGTALKGAAWVSGDLLAAGTPDVVLNGQPTFAGTIDANGSPDPAGYVITLDGGSVLRHVVRRVDPLALPTVLAPAAPAGTRDVTLNAASQQPGDFSTVRNLTLNGNAGTVAVPPGTYGQLTANGTAAFVLGRAGATAADVYELQALTLNGASSLRVAGPVVVILANGTTVNGTIGDATHPEWLSVQIARGGLTANGNAVISGAIIAPLGAVQLNSGAIVTGRVSSDALIINGTASLRQPAP